MWCGKEGREIESWYLFNTYFVNHSVCNTLQYTEKSMRDTKKTEAENCIFGAETQGSHIPGH